MSIEDLVITKKTNESKINLYWLHNVFEKIRSYTFGSIMHNFLLQYSANHKMFLQSYIFNNILLYNTSKLSLYDRNMMLRNSETIIFSNRHTL